MDKNYGLTEKDKEILFKDPSLKIVKQDMTSNNTVLRHNDTFEKLKCKNSIGWQFYPPVSTDPLPKGENFKIQAYNPNTNTGYLYNYVP